MGVLVDTGSNLTWFTEDVLESMGNLKLRQRGFIVATKQTVIRDIDYAILQSEDFETIDEVVFAEPGDMNLLGVRTIEGFGAMEDEDAHRFIAITSLVVRTI